jgi:hypothetical protein
MADKVVIPFIGDSTQLNNELRKVENNAKRTGSEVEKTFAAIGAGIKFAAAVQVMNASLSVARAGMAAFRGETEQAMGALERLPLGVGNLVRQTRELARELSGVNERRLQEELRIAEARSRSAIEADELSRGRDSMINLERQERMLNRQIDIQSAVTDHKKEQIAIEQDYQTVLQQTAAMIKGFGGNEDQRRMLEAQIQRVLLLAKGRRDQALFLLQQKQELENTRQIEQAEEDRLRVVRERMNENARASRDLQSQIEMNQKLLDGQPQEAQMMDIIQKFEGMLNDAISNLDFSRIPLLETLRAQELAMVQKDAENILNSAQERLLAMQNSQRVPRFMGLQEAAREFATSQLGGPDLQKQQLDEAKKQVAEQKKTVEVLRELGNKIGGPAVFAE